MSLVPKLKPKTPAGVPAGKNTSSAPAKSAAPFEGNKRGGSSITPASTQQRTLVRPRQRQVTSNYSYRDNSAGFGGIPEGNFCYAKDAPSLTVISPDWYGKHPTTFRPYPAVDEDGYSFLPARYSVKDRDFTPWVWTLPVAKKIGMENSRVSFILYDPRWKNDRGYIPRENPYNILYYALNEVVSSDDPSAMLGNKDVYHGRWNKIFEKGFSQPRNRATFMQGAVYQHRDKIYVQKGRAPFGLGKDDNPVVIEMLSGSVNDAVNELLMQKREGARVSDDDIMGSFVYGDPTLLNGGAFLSIFNPDRHKDAVRFQFQGGAAPAAEGKQQKNKPDEVLYEDPTDDDSDDDGRGSRKKKKKEFTMWQAAAGYDFIYLNEDGDKRKVRPDLTPYADRIREQFLWFDDVFHFPEHEEIVEHLARAFRGIPNMIYFGFREHPEFMTNSVKGILAARTQGPGAEIPSDDDDDASPPTRAKGRRSSTLIDEAPSDELSDDELIDSEDAFVDDDVIISAEEDEDLVDLDESEFGGDDVEVISEEVVVTPSAAKPPPLVSKSAAQLEGALMAKKKATKKPALKPVSKPTKKSK